MRLAETMIRIMNRLGAIPGLSFLGGYVVSAKASHTRFGQRKGDYEAYINNIRRAGSDVGELAGGANSGDMDEQEGEYDELAEYEHEYDEEYEESEGDDYSVGLDLSDDYPASDENTSYFDDDYPSR